MFFLAPVLALGVTTVWAAPGPPAYYPPPPPRYSSSTKCYTTYASTKCSPPKTYWTTYHTPCTSSQTVTRTTTITPPTVTSTTLTTVTTTTTAPSVILTDTTTTTRTIDSTITETSTSTTTSTTTSTSTSTTTVAAPVGFVPVQTSLPGSSYQGLGGQPPVRKRGYISANPNREARDALGGISVSLDLSSSSHGKPKYPKKVNCHKWTHSTKCSTLTSTKTSTVTGSTPSTTITRTSTVTSTIVPSATTTSTVTTTSTSISTETSTSTTTQTTTESTTSTLSLYAACSTPNLADTFDNQRFNSYSTFSGTSNFVGTNANTAYDCCVNAVTLDPSRGTAIAFLKFLDSSTCLISVNTSQDTCPAGGQADNTAVVGYGANEQKFIIGNGLCGSIIEARQAP